MNCSKCGIANESDSIYCSGCGTLLYPQSRKLKKIYLYALVLLPFILAIAGIGYYKFMLPGGIAAVVNGEEIGISELETAVRSMQLNREAELGRDAFTTGEGERALKRLRYEALSSLISAKIIQQAARGPGAEVSQEEIEAAFSRAVVRIAISEQWSGAGCGACSGGCNQKRPTKDQGEL